MARRSSGRFMRPMAGVSRAKRSTRCGIWCGAAWSPTTRSTVARLHARARVAESEAPPATGCSGLPFAPTRPPSAEGRWTLVSRRDADARRRRRAHAGHERRAAVKEQNGPRPSTQQLLARHGVADARIVNTEAVPGGSVSVYPVLKSLEENGRIRRGYFVAGLGATQFALPGAVDLLRSLRDGGPADEAPPIKTSWCSRRPIRPIPTARRSGSPAWRRFDLRQLGGQVGEAGRGASRVDRRVGRRHGHARQRFPGGVPRARRSPARHVSARRGARSIEDRPRCRAGADRSRPQRAASATRHADRGDRRPPAGATHPIASSARRSWFRRRRAWGCRPRSAAKSQSPVSGLSRKSPVISQESTSSVESSVASPFARRYSKIRT